MKTNTIKALSKLKDFRDDIQNAITKGDFEITISESDLKNIEFVIQIIKMLENDYERIYDKIVMSTMNRALLIGHENIKNDEICQTLIAISNSEH